MRQLLLLPISVVFLLSGCSQKIEYKEILAFPVYGQSLALAEEAERISDNKELQSYGGRILTQNLDTDFGYFADTWLKQRIKRLIGYKKRSFELSSYGMAEYMIDNDMIEKGQALCIFPGGRGATAINGLVKGTQPYNKFMSEIKTAYDRASKRGVVFRVPAVCYMHGETDIAPNARRFQISHFENYLLLQHSLCQGYIQIRHLQSHLNFSEFEQNKTMKYSDTTL